MTVKRPSITEAVKQFEPKPITTALDILTPGTSPASPAAPTPAHEVASEPAPAPDRRAAKRPIGIASYRLYKDQIASLRSLATQRANARGEGKADASEIIREILDEYFSKKPAP